MQVVGSSRISNTAYLAVASIYWTLFLTVTEFPLILDVQTALVLVTPPAGIAALLWVLRVEEFLITRFLLFWMPKYPNGKFIRYHMGYSAVHIQPWKESLDDLTTISQSLKKEARRVLRSPFLKEEMENIFQLFWLMISVPAIFIILGLQLSVSENGFWILVIIAIVLNIVLFLVTITRKRVWPFRALGLAFCNWYIDMIGGMDRRRISFSPDKNLQFPLRHPKFFPQHEPISTIFAEKTTPWIDELLAIVNREDWHGFEQNLVTFLNSQDVYYKKMTTSDIFTTLVNDIIWSFKRKRVMEPYEEGVTISFDQAHPLGHLRRTKLYTLDALKETDGLRPKTSTVSWITELTDFLETLDTLLGWEEIYRILSKEIVEKLPEHTMKALAEIPFFMNNPKFKLEEIWNFRAQKLWTLDVTMCFCKAVDQKLIAPLTVFMIASRWGVMPKHYVKECGPLVRPLILEVDAGIPALELKEVIFEVIRDSPNLDTMKVVTTLTSYKHDSGFEDIVKSLRRTVQSHSGALHSKKVKVILEKLGIDTSKL